MEKKVAEVEVPKELKDHLLKAWKSSEKVVEKLTGKETEPPPVSRHDVNAALNKCIHETEQCINLVRIDLKDEHFVNNQFMDNFHRGEESMELLKDAGQSIHLLDVLLIKARKLQPKDATEDSEEVKALTMLMELSTERRLDAAKAIVQHTGYAYSLLTAEAVAG